MVDIGKTELESSVVNIAEGDSSYFIFLPDAEVDYIQSFISKNKLPYEHGMLVNMCSYIKQGDAVIDVGANIGNHTLYLAAVCGAKVFAFEPNMHLANALCRSVELNDLNGRVHVSSIAIGETKGFARFEREILENLGAQSLLLGDGEIVVSSLDEQAIEQPIRMIKIDVEGMEADVLRGAKDIILRDNPIIYIECGDDDSFREILKIIDGFEYYYWDTFNATPTHLFVPKSDVSYTDYVKFTQNKRIEAVSNSYREKCEIDNLRESLDLANLKYRNVNIQYAEKKDKFDSLVTALNKSFEDYNAIIASHGEKS